MENSSNIYSATDSAWSAITSIAPAMFDRTALPGNLIDQHEITGACETLGLIETDLVASDQTLLGSGASYQVYACKIRQWDHLVAVKHLKSELSHSNIETLSSPWSRQATVLREIWILSLFKDHPSFVTLLGYGKTLGGDFSLVTEYAPIGTLDVFLKKHGAELASPQLFGIFADIAEGLRALHEHKIAHGDVKAANILMFNGPSQGRPYSAKINDLGFTLSLVFDEADACYRGTELYNAPELRCEHSRRLCDLDPLACDVFSFGLLVWTMFKSGDFFLSATHEALQHGEDELAVRSAVSTPRLLEYALEFARSQDPRHHRDFLERIFIGTLQETPGFRSSMDDLCQILPPEFKQLRPIAVQIDQVHDVSTLIFNKAKSPDLYRFPDVLHAGHPYHSLPQKHKQMLAGKWIRAAKDHTHFDSAELALTASRCFAVGFGIARDLTLAMQWARIAADGGDDLAQILIANGNTSTATASLGPEDDVNEMDLLANLLLDAERNRARRQFESIDMGHIENFEAYFGNNPDEIEHAVRQSLSWHDNIDALACRPSTSSDDDRPNDRNKTHRMPLLHWAAATGRWRVVSCLIVYGANLDATDGNRTAMQYALATGNIEIAELLLRNGAQFDNYAVSYLFMVPPQRLGTFRSLRRSRHLDCTGPHPGPPLGPVGAFVEDETALSFAVRFNNSVAIEAYLAPPMGSSWTARQYHTAVQIAARNLQAPILNQLLDYASEERPDLDNPMPSVAQGTLFDWMILNRFDDGPDGYINALALTVTVIVAHGFDINGRDESGASAMSHAITQHANDPTVAATLFAHGAALDWQGGDGRTLLDIAILAVRRSDNVGCVGWLLDNAKIAPDLARCIKFGTPLQHACDEQATGAARALLEHGQADITIRWDARGGFTLLHTACLLDCVLMVQLLIEYGADVTAIDYHSYTPIECAVHIRSIGVIDYFLEKWLAFENPHFDPPRSILSSCAAQSPTERRILFQSVLRHTLRLYPEHLSARDENGLTPLAIAAERGHCEYVLDLLEAGASIGIVQDAKTAWNALVEKHAPYQYHHTTGDDHQIRRYKKVLEALARELKPDHLTAQDGVRKTLLCQAAFATNTIAVGELLKHGAAVNPFARGDLSPLHFACFGVLEATSNPLGKVVNASNGPSWKGPWELSAARALIETMTLLLDKGADVNTISHSSISVLHFATLAAWRLDHMGVVDLLLERGANVNQGALSDLDVLPIHFAFEAAALVNSITGLGSEPALEPVPIDEVRQMRVLQQLSKRFLAAGTRLNFLAETERFGLTWVLMAVDNCNPVALSVMLQAAVPLLAALGTCNRASIRTDAYIRFGQAVSQTVSRDTGISRVHVLRKREKAGRPARNRQLVTDWINESIENGKPDPDQQVIPTDQTTLRELGEILMDDERIKSLWVDARKSLEDPTSAMSRTITGTLQQEADASTGSSNVVTSHLRENMVREVNSVLDKVRIKGDGQTTIQENRINQTVSHAGSNFDRERGENSSHLLPWEEQMNQLARILGSRLELRADDDEDTKAQKLASLREHAAGLELADG